MSSTMPVASSSTSASKSTLRLPKKAIPASDSAYCPSHLVKPLVLLPLDVPNSHKNSSLLELHRKLKGGSPGGVSINKVLKISSPNNNNVVDDWKKTRMLKSHNSPYLKHMKIRDRELHLIRMGSISELDSVTDDELRKEITLQTQLSQLLSPIKREDEGRIDKNKIDVNILQYIQSGNNSIEKDGMRTSANGLGTGMSQQPGGRGKYRKMSSSSENRVMMAPITSPLTSSHHSLLSPSSVNLNRYGMEDGEMISSPANTLAPILSKSQLQQHQQQYQTSLGMGGTNGKGKETSTLARGRKQAGRGRGRGGRGGRGGRMGGGGGRGNGNSSFKISRRDDSDSPENTTNSHDNQADYWTRPHSINSVNSISTLGSDNSCSGVRGALASNSSLSVSSSEAGSEYGVFEGELVSINNFDDELISTDGSNL